jgi:sugar (pentulose or hexulose) kinase
MLAVLDIGKTHSRILVLDADGSLRAERRRKNVSVDRGGILAAEAIEQWLMTTLAELAREFSLSAIVPVAHGATAALVDGDRLAAPVLDYEADPPAAIATAYDKLRDGFAHTLSPRLPHGLNLGLQFFWQETLHPELWPSRAEALLWPQYWAWVFSGEKAAEVTILGCHTDLWSPPAHTFSTLAVGRGWAKKLGPLAPAFAVLGTLRRSVAEATGLDKACKVLCGIHDSNAALFGTRGFAELAGKPFALVSTGTWFVAMQSGGGEPVLDPARDTLANVDVHGNTVPSARFMGGREYEHIADVAARSNREAALRLISRNAMTRPTFAPGCGPFPDSRGAILGDVRGDDERASLGALHLALMSDQSLDLVAARGALVIEGRFAEDEVFPAALAALRPQQPVYCSAVDDGVALGAARLADPRIVPKTPLRAVAPLEGDLETYRSNWLREIARGRDKP